MRQPQRGVFSWLVDGEGVGVSGGRVEKGAKRYFARLANENAKKAFVAPGDDIASDGGEAAVDNHPLRDCVDFREQKCVTRRETGDFGGTEREGGHFDLGVQHDLADRRVRSVEEAQLAERLGKRGGEGD